MIDIAPLLNKLKTDVEGLATIGGVRIGQGDLTKLEPVACEIQPDVAVYDWRAAGSDDTLTELIVKVTLYTYYKQEDPEAQMDKLLAVHKAFIELFTGAYQNALTVADQIIPIGSEFAYERDSSRFYVAIETTLQCGWE